MKFLLCTPCGNQVGIHSVETTMPELSSAGKNVELQGHNFHFKFSSTSPDKVWMWHEMREGSRANWYLINARPDWRAQAHLLHVSSNMHDIKGLCWTSVLNTAEESAWRKERGKNSNIYTQTKDAVKVWWRGEEAAHSSFRSVESQRHFFCATLAAMLTYDNVVHWAV